MKENIPTHSSFGFLPVEGLSTDTHFYANDNEMNNVYEFHLPGEILRLDR